MVDLPDPPFTPLHGRVTIMPLPWKPSKIVEVVSNDKEMISEGYVVRTSPKRLARKKTKRGEILSYGEGFEHEVRRGDRVIFKPHFQDDDHVVLNGQKLYNIDANDISGKFDVERPEGYENPITGEKQPDSHPLLFL